MRTVSRAPVILGQVIGRIELAPELVSVAARLANDEVWDAAAAAQFSDEAVTTFELPANFPPANALIPVDALANVGLEFDDKARQELVATYDVDPHEDDIHGLVLFLVLRNDGLTFKQGKARHVTAAGEFFVFDDRKSHGVRGVRGRGVYLGWSIPIRRV